MKLVDSLESRFRLTEKQKRALKRLGLFSVSDLLFYFPTRYSDMSVIKKIVNLKPGETATIYGKISKLKTKKAYRSGKPIAEGVIEDLSGKINIIWFNQAYIAKMLKDGQNIKLTGRITDGKKGLYLANPEAEQIPELPIDSHKSLFEGGKQTGLSFPVYRESRGITSKWFYHAVLKIFKNKTLEEIKDYIPKGILKKYNLPTLQTALVWIHTPKKLNDAEVARKRFAFEEVFCIQLKRQKEKFETKKKKAFSVDVDEKDVKNFVSRFPWKLTGGQERALEEIFSDFKKDHPMSRLLEGDVGSGKTAVAATASYAIIRNTPANQDFGNLQVAYMAPTEILANQHFESFIEYFAHTGINMGLITGSGCKKFPSKVNPETATKISKSQLLRWVANGEIPILIGTHSLIYKSVKFKHLALGIVDEQHRFGTKQRAKLAGKEGFASHFLSMTATPIPRTLALTIYGDLDLTLLDEMPKGRKQVVTEIVTPNNRDKTYDFIKKKMEEGHQLYVICPRIDEPDPSKQTALQVKSVKAEAARLKREVFKNLELGILHSKMKKQKKEEVMKSFARGKLDILVATSVVEVGVNVPNATMIIIEGAERFGLAQLHQLRGRVQRSTYQAYCFIFAESKTKKTLDRLRALRDAKNGFELAEMDLMLRGAGELSGAKQWGISDLAMEAIKNIKMVEAARSEAVRMIESDPELKKHSGLKSMVAKKASEFHFE